MQSSMEQVKNKTVAQSNSTIVKANIFPLFLIICKENQYQLEILNTQLYTYSIPVCKQQL